MRHAAWLVLMVASPPCILAKAPRPAAPRAGKLNWKTLPRPPQRQFIVDLAGMIEPNDQKKIQALCQRLLTEKATPIVVVTIKSMAEHGGKGMRIETFAQLLFDQWGIGVPQLRGEPWNTGILLLVAKGDREARIELGAGWKRLRDAQCQKIMDEQIIPRFKEGDFSGGILAGVRALEKMARELKLPAPPAALWPARRFCYIPPGVEGRVRFYHAFEMGADKPEVNLLGAKLSADAKGWCDAGLTGRGYATGRLAAGKPAGKRGLTLDGLSIALNRPITVSLWWRLDEPMKADTCFHLIGLHGQQGYISNFVRGRGQWCALTRPTFVVQVYRFAGISNVNGIYFGHAWMEHAKWHHAAVTVSAGSQVSVYWDGRARSSFPVKGRLLSGRDLIRTIRLGASWLAHPMTIDEILILDRAMSAAEIADYVTAVRKLAEMQFPFSAGGTHNLRCAPVEGATLRRP
jgi:hypothetical protein